MLAGAVFVALLLAGILINEYVFAGVFALLTGLALYEFYSLVSKEEQIPLSKKLGIVAGIVLFLSAYAYSFHGISVLFAVYILFMLAIAIGELYFKRENPIRSLAYIIWGQLYVAIPFALTNYLIDPFGTGVFQGTFLLAICVLIWVNDTFAYLTGMMFGKHRLFERISPKKSWEGFIGGACFAVGVSITFAHFAGGQLGIVGWIGFALITVAFGTWGDLIESLIKRTLNVKDSGNMIPGHGGILDRMDSTILAIPAVVAYLIIFNFIISL